MKTLMIVVMTVLSPDYGLIGSSLTQMSYAPSMEECRTEGYSFARKQLYTEYRDILELELMVCMDLNEEESASEEASTAAGKEFLGK